MYQPRKSRSLKTCLSVVVIGVFSYKRNGTQKQNIFVDLSESDFQKSDWVKLNVSSFHFFVIKTQIYIYKSERLTYTVPLLFDNNPDK